MTRSARAAALRSTALATSLALAVGLSAFAVEAAAKPKVPLPKPRPIARNVVPTTAAQNTAPRRHRRNTAAGRDRRARRARLGSPPPASPRLAAAAAQAVGAGRDRRDVVDLAGRYRGAGKRHRAGAQAQAGGCDAGASRDIRSGREEARGMGHPAQRRQQRLGRALSRLHLGQSELALADFHAPAPRGGAVGRPSRRRHGLGLVRKRIAAARPRASSRWRAP